MAKAHPRVFIVLNRMNMLVENFFKSINTFLSLILDNCETRDLRIDTQDNASLLKATIHSYSLSAGIKDTAGSAEGTAKRLTDKAKMR